MRNEVQIIKFDGSTVRVVAIDGEPWWVGRDVCAYFGDTNHRRSLARLQDDERMIAPVVTTGGVQQMSVVNEAGLYALLFNFEPEKGVSHTDPSFIRERIEKIARFRRWVTSEVLPSIRKYGLYGLDPHKLISMALVEAQKIIDDQRPAVEFHEAVMASKDGILVRELAKDISGKMGCVIGQNRLYGKLREWKMIFPAPSCEPYQSAIDAGLLQRKMRTYTDSSGESHIEHTTLVAGKGAEYITRRWLKEQGGAI